MAETRWNPSTVLLRERERERLEYGVTSDGTRPAWKRKGKKKKKKEGEKKRRKEIRGERK